MIVAGLAAAAARATRVRLVAAAAVRASALARPLHGCAPAAAGRGGRAREQLVWDKHPAARSDAAVDEVGESSGKVFHWDGRRGSTRTSGEAWQARSAAPRWEDADRAPRTWHGGRSGGHSSGHGDDGGRRSRVAGRDWDGHRLHPSQQQQRGGRDVVIDVTDGRALRLDLSGGDEGAPVHVAGATRAPAAAAFSDGPRREQSLPPARAVASAGSDASPSSTVRKQPAASRHAADAEAAIAAAHAAAYSPAATGGAGSEAPPALSRPVYPMLTSDTYKALMAHANVLCRGDVLAALRPATFNNLCELVGAVMRSGTTVGGDRVAALRLQTAVLDALEARRDAATGSRVGTARAWLGSLAAALGAYEHGLDYVAHAHAELRAHYDRMTWEQAADAIGGGKDLDVRWLFAHKSLPVASAATVHRVLQPALDRYAVLVCGVDAGGAAAAAHATAFVHEHGTASAHRVAEVLDALMPALVVCNKFVDKLEATHRPTLLRPLFASIAGEPHLAAWGRAASPGAGAHDPSTTALPAAHERLVACAVIMQQLAFLRGHLAVAGAAAVRAVDDAFVSALAQGGMDALAPHLRVYVAECCLRMRAGLPDTYHALRRALTPHLAAADPVLILLDANECRKQLATGAGAASGAVPASVSLQSQGEATIAALFHSIYITRGAGDAHAARMPVMTKPQLRLAARATTLHWHDAKHVARLTDDGLRQLCYVISAQHRTLCAHGVASPSAADLHEMCWEELARRRPSALASNVSATRWCESVAALNGRFEPVRRLEALLREAAAPATATASGALEGLGDDHEASLLLHPGGSADVTATSPLRTSTRRLMHAALSDAVARVFARADSEVADGAAAVSADSKLSSALVSSAAGSPRADGAAYTALDSVLAPVCAFTQCIPFQASTEPWYERAAAALFGAVAAHPVLAAWGSAESAVPAAGEPLQRLLAVIALMQSLTPLRGHVGLGGRDAFRALDSAVLCALHQGALDDLSQCKRERVAVMLAEAHSSMQVSCPALWHALQPTLEAAARDTDAAVARSKDIADVSSCSSLDRGADSLTSVLAARAHLSSRLHRVAGHSDVLDVALIRALAVLAADDATGDSLLLTATIQVLSTVAAWGLPSDASAADARALLAAAAVAQERRYATMARAAAPDASRPLAERLADACANRHVFDAAHWLHTVAVVTTLVGQPFAPLVPNATRFLLDSLSAAGLAASADAAAVVKSLDGIADRRLALTVARVLSKVATVHAAAVAEKGLDAACELIPAAVRDVCVAAFSDVLGPADAAKALLRRHHASAHGLESLGKAAASKMEQLVVQAVAEYCAAHHLPAPVWQYAVTSLRAVVDVAWPAARVMLEVDGPSHYQPLSPSQQAAELARRQHAAWDPARYHQDVNVVLLVGSPSDIGADYKRPAPRGAVLRSALERAGWLVYRLPLEHLPVPTKSQRSLRTEDASAVLQSLTSMGLWEAIRRAATEVDA